MRTNYPFNLGLLALQSVDFTAAAAAFRDASNAKPENPEDRALLVHPGKSGKEKRGDQERESAAKPWPNALQSAHVDVKPTRPSDLRAIRTELDTTALRLEMPASGSARIPHRPVRYRERSVAHSPRTPGAGRHLDSSENEFAACCERSIECCCSPRPRRNLLIRCGKSMTPVKELQPRSTLATPLSCEPCSRASISNRKNQIWRVPKPSAP